MTIPSVDLDQSLATLLSTSLSALNTQPVAPATPDPISFGEQTMGALQALIQRTNGENPLPPSAIPTGVARVLARSVSDFDTAGSAAAQAVFSYTTVAGAIPDGSILRLTIEGHLSNNDNGNIRSYTMRFNFGGVTLWQSTAQSYSGLTAFVHRPFRYQFNLVVQSQTLHVLYGTCVQAPASNGAIVGVGDLGNVGGGVAGVCRGIDSTVDLASARLLEVTVQNSNANATIHWVRRSAVLEII